MSYVMGGWTVLVLLTVMSAMYAGTRTIGVEASPSGGTNRAFKIARVTTDWPGDHESYSGFVQTNITADIRLFFWFCKAKRGKRGTAPVLLWLNGGPGYTSLIGALLENGPYQLNENGTVSERKYAWTNEFHMLYVDNPVGVGYSYSSKGITQHKIEDIAENVFQLVFLLMYARFQQEFDNGLYIGGQSYAGKYIPHLGERIHRWNMQAVGNERINLQGVYLGNALCDPETMFPVYPDALYHMGLISTNTRIQYRRLLEDIIRRTINNGNIFDFENDMEPFSSVPMNIQSDLESLLAPEKSIQGGMEALQAFMNKSTTRRILNVDWHLNKSGIFNYDVFSTVVTHDFILHTREQNKLLMNNYKVLQYSGNLDLLVPVAMTEKFLDRVQWSGREQYRRTNYTQWTIGQNQLAGWYATTGNFTRVIVRNAGHSVPFYKPQASLEMMKRFVYGQFNTKLVAADHAQHQLPGGPQKGSAQMGW